MQSNRRRGLLVAFIVSIAVCGVIGIYCILFDDFTILQQKLLATSCSIAGVSMLAMAAAITWERRQWHPIGPAAVIAAGLALLSTLFAIWYQPDHFSRWQWGWDTREVIADTMWTGWLLATTLTLIGLIGLARLRRQLIATQYLTVLFLCIVASGLQALLLDARFDEFFARLLGATAVIAACGVIAMPILHRISAIPANDAIQTTEMQLSLVCPRCEKQQVLPAGRSECLGCRLRFRIEIEENQCQQCGYSLYRITSSVCPECGTPISAPPESVQRAAAVQERLDEHTTRSSSQANR